VFSAVAPAQQRASARTSPKWLREGVVYEIYPRAFSQEGNFNGVTARLDALKDIGVTILWLMPIHPIGQEKKKGTIGSPYAVRDFYAINRDYGTKEDLKRLVTEAHRRGMKVFIDIVANHTSWDNVMMRTPEYYMRDASGKMLSPYDWTDVAELNYENPKLRQYMKDMLKYWIREFNLDGFRCDVAGEVPTDFWEQARAEIEKIKPDIAMLAEAFKPELLVKAFDFDYAWPFFHAITDTVNGKQPSTILRKIWDEERATFPEGALHMRFIDNHDERRAIARLGERGSLAAAALVFTLDGVPMIYNGMEVGDTAESGAPALFERMPIFWKSSERRREYPRFYRHIISLRREHAALRDGETVWITNSEPSRIVTYLRRDGNEEFLIAINFSNQPFTGTVESGGKEFVEVMSSNAVYAGEATEPPPRVLSTLALDGWGFRIFHGNRK
jgi:glycosidase